MNAKQVNKALEDEIAALRRGDSTPARANSVVRLASTVVRTAALELAYFRALGKKSALSFFNQK